MNEVSPEHEVPQSVLMARGGAGVLRLPGPVMASATMACLLPYGLEFFFVANGVLSEHERPCWVILRSLAAS